jgi:ABC-2 type transport system ATP-binding protein
VSGVSRRREEVLVTGSGDLLQAVTAVLARHGVAAAGLEHERTNLEDAYVALTVRKTEERVS